MAKLPNKSKLMSSLNKMTHSGRVREMALLGRDHAGSDALEALLNTLNADYQEWQMRLVAARAARSLSHILEGARHPYRDIRAASFKSLAFFDLDMEMVTDLLDSAPSFDRRALIATVRNSGNTSLADDLLPWVHQRHGDSEAAVLLPACSEHVAADWLPRLDHSVANWAAMARSHPDVFLDFAREHLSAAPIIRPAWWERLGPGIATLVRSHTNDVLDLWAEFGPLDDVPVPLRSVLNQLAGLAPDRTIELLLRPAMRLTLETHVRGIRRKLHKANRTTLMALAEALGHSQTALATMLKNLAPGLREPLFRNAMAGQDPSTLVIWHSLFDVLPHEVRHAEAQRMLGLSYVGDDERQRRELLALLPIEDSWDQLVEYTRASDATIRGDAYARLIGGVLRSRQHTYFEKLLDELQRMRNEQDRVRMVAMAELRDVAPSMIQLSDMERLSDLALFAAEARDTSPRTRWALQQLFTRILVSSATPERRGLIPHSVDAIALLSDRGLNLFHHPEQLPAGGEFILFDALEQRMNADIRAGRPAFALSLARSLGTRGWKIDGLQKLLWKIATTSQVRGAAAEAAGLYQDQRGKKSARAGELMAFDSSASLLHPVFETLSIARQDLLDKAFKPEATRGWFATSQQPEVRLVNSSTRRWNTNQRSVYAQHLASAASNEHIVHLRAAALRVLGGIPEFGLPRIVESLDDSETQIVEAALGALCYGQRPELQLDRLFSYAGSDRAKVAIYAAGRAARYARPADITESVRRLLANDSAKLTARKEALRILGRTRGEGAVELFADVWGRRPLNRDLAIGLVSALRNFPNEPLTWQVLGEIANGSADEALALVTASTPLTWPARVRPELGDLIVPLAMHEDHHVRVASSARLLQWRPSNDQVADLLRKRVVDLASRRDLGSTVHQIHQLIEGYPTDPLLPAAVGDLVAQQTPADSNGGAERDRPIEQRLQMLANYTPVSSDARKALSAAGTAAGDAGYATEACAFHVRAIDWSDPGEALRDLARFAASNPGAVPSLYQAVRNALSQQQTRAERDPDALAAAARDLSDGDNEADAIVALAIVSTLGPASGWSPRWRQLIVDLRRNESVWIRHHAHSVLTADE